MIVEFGNQPLEVHKPFHASAAAERVCFGAVGSGKTFAIMDESIALCLQYPGIRGMITRKTIPELRDTTEPAFAERMPPDLFTACDITKTGGHYDRCIFPNGSTIYFRSMDDWRKHKSFNLGFIAWDEMSEFSEEDYIGMTLHRLRQRDPTAEARALGYTTKIPYQFSFGATNPEGKNWVYRYFHPESKDESYRNGSAAFFSTTLDNPFLGHAYVERLLTMPKHYIQRYVLCQFDDFAGKIYDEWGEQHFVEHPNWRAMGVERPLVWMGMDPGTESPTAGLWCWMDVDNRRLVGIAEYQQPGLAVDQHVAAWRAIEARQRMLVRWRVADPNAITQRDRGSSIQLSTQYQKLGYYFNFGASSHRDRIPALAHLIHLNRFVVSRNCPLTFEAIKNYQWRDLTPAQKARGEDPTEEPLKRNTHLVECAQYLAGRESPLPHPSRRNVPKDWNAELWQAVKQHQASKRRRVGRVTNPLGIHL